MNMFKYKQQIENEQNSWEHFITKENLLIRKIKLKP